MYPYVGGRRFEKKIDFDMRYVGLLFSGLATAFIGTCIAGCSEARDEWPTTELAADSVVVSQIIKPEGWAVTGDHCVVQSVDTDTIFYVYSLPDFRFRYCAVTSGEGPQEMNGSNVEILPGSRGEDTLSVVDWLRKKLWTFAVGTDSMRRTEEVNLDFSVFDPICALPGRKAVCLGWKMKDDDTNGLELADYGTGEKMDSLTLRTWRKTMQGDHFTIQTVVNMVNCALAGEVLGILYEYTGRVEFYDLSGGRFALQRALGDERSREQLRQMDFDGQETGTIYGPMVSDGAYFYALESEYRTADGDGGGEPEFFREKKLLSSAVRVFDRKGRLVKRYVLDRPVDGICAYKGTLYAYDSRQDFEQVYVFATEQAE